MRLHPSLIATGVLLLSLVLQPTRPVSAASITVTTTNDELNTDSACSLREAIQAVNTLSSVSGCAAGSGNDTIVLPAGTYQLTIAGPNEDLNATGDLDIFPPPLSVPRTLVIQGSGATTTVVDGNQLDRVFHLISEDGTLILRDLTVRNGLVPNTSDGGAVLALGRIELYNVIVEDNAISGPLLTSGATGGGLCLGCGPGTGSGYLENVIFRNNSAGVGGGIFSNRPLTVTASSFYSNTVAVAGGAIATYGDLTLVNVTVTSNAAGNSGGGIVHFAGSLNLLNSTISHNTNHGVRFDVSTASIKNTIIGKNTVSDCQILNAPTSQGSNLSSDTSCTFLTASGDRTNVDPQLGPLQDNGGPTPTRAPALTSPAVDGGTNAGCPATDQRGITRPQGQRCDIGAYELVLSQRFVPLTTK